MIALKKPWLLLVILAALVVAACGPAPATTPAPPTASPEAAKPPPPTAAAPQATAAKPAAEATPSKPAAAARPPIKIGLLQPLTGPQANVGKDNQDGFDLYMEKIGWTVAGRKIEKVVEDDEFKADVGLTKTRKLVENDKVNIIAGLHNSAVCIAIAPYVTDGKVPTVVTGNCGGDALNPGPALGSPYIFRTTQVPTMPGFALSEWLVKNNYRKVVLIISDYAAGLQIADGFARSFIEEGGTIVQELYPALGTTDFGPFLAQIKSDADAAVSFIVGVDGLRLGQQYTEYGWKGKLPLFDLFATIVAGPNLAELKDAGVGIIAAIHYATDTDTPQNKEFLAAVRAKYPGRLLSHDVAAGWAGAMVLEAATKAVDGDVENKDKFLAALKRVELVTPKGPFKFDEFNTVVQNIYIKRIDKVGNEYVEKTLATVPNISLAYKWKPEEGIKFLGKLKGKWVNVNKEQMQNLLKPLVQ